MKQSKSVSHSLAAFYILFFGAIVFVIIWLINDALNTPPIQSVSAAQTVLSSYA
jgi:hypothetical protein